MFCPKCGASLDDNAAFCSHCGTPIEKKPAAAQSAQPAQPAVHRAATQTPAVAPAQPAATQTPNAAAGKEASKKAKASAAAPTVAAQPPAGKKKSKKPVVIVIIIIVLIALVVAFLALRNCSTPNKTQEPQRDTTTSTATQDSSAVQAEENLTSKVEFSNVRMEQDSCGRSCIKGTVENTSDADMQMVTYTIAAKGVTYDSYGDEKLVDVTSLESNFGSVTTGMSAGTITDFKAGEKRDFVLVPEQTSLGTVKEDGTESHDYLTDPKITVKTVTTGIGSAATTYSYNAASNQVSTSHGSTTGHSAGTDLTATLSNVNLEKNTVSITFTNNTDLYLKTVEATFTAVDSKGDAIDGDSDMNDVSIVTAKGSLDYMKPGESRTIENGNISSSSSWNLKLSTTPSFTLIDISYTVDESKTTQSN